MDRSLRTGTTQDGDQPRCIAKQFRLVALIDLALLQPVDPKLLSHNHVAIQRRDRQRREVIVDLPPLLGHSRYSAARV